MSTYRDSTLCLYSRYLEGLYLAFVICFPSCFSFRKQHEQLQAVIVRVLRPTAVQGQPRGAAGAEQAGAGDQIETDDLSAVREVKLAYENVKVVDCLDLTPEGNAAWEAALKRSVVELGRGDIVVFSLIFGICPYNSLCNNVHSKPLKMSGCTYC